jgi:hypothetical protein
MPLIKRKKVTLLPIPKPLAVLPDPAEQQRFLESAIPDAGLDVQDTQFASSGNANGSSSRREQGKVNGSSARYGDVDPWNDDIPTSRTEEFVGVVLESHRTKAPHHGSSASTAEPKTWQPLKESQRLFSARLQTGKNGTGTTDVDGEGEEDALLAPENRDDKLLETLLVLKQKQADILAVKRRTRSAVDPVANGKRPRSGKKADKTEEPQHAGGANGERVLEEATRADDPERYDAGKVPLQLGKWVEPEVYMIAKTGEIFETYE